MSVAAIYELDTPFTEEQLPSLNYEQSADVFILTHMGRPITRVRRYDHNRWLLDDAPIGPQITPPTGVVATANSPQSGSSDYIATVKYYVVTAVNAAGQESQPSAGVNAVNDLSLRGDYNVITWAAHPEAVEYRIYEERSGVFGYLGTAKAGFMSFNDDNIQANFADGPPRSFNPFAGGNNPATITFHESRMWLARSLTMPNALWGSQTDDVFNFDKSSPIRATDSIALRLRARRMNTIRHLVPMKDLAVFTSDMIFSIRGTGDGYLSPTTIKSVPEGHRGVGRAKPELIADVAFYTSVSENSIHTLGYTFEKDGYRGNDITVFASHFFVNHQVMQMCWTDAPASVLWVRRADGKLAALTWMQEQEVWGWTLCETDGVVESVCSVPEGRRDVLYAVVRRTINGEQKRYIEYMSEAHWIRQGWDDLAGAVVMDCAIAFEREEPFVSVSGVDWLEGREVICLADGFVIRGRSIINGRLTPDLPDPATRLVVGLPYETRIRTLPAAGPVQGLGSLKGRRQSIANVALEVQNTGGMGSGLLLSANRPASELPTRSAPKPAGVLTQTPPMPYTGVLETDGVEASDWTDACVDILQTDPLPLVVLGVYPDLEVGR